MGQRCILHTSVLFALPSQGNTVDPQTLLNDCWPPSQGLEQLVVGVQGPHSPKILFLFTVELGKILNELCNSISSGLLFIGGFPCSRDFEASYQK